MRVRYVETEPETDPERSHDDGGGVVTYAGYAGEGEAHEGAELEADPAGLPDEVTDAFADDPFPDDMPDGDFASEEDLAEVEDDEDHESGDGVPGDAHPAGDGEPQGGAGGESDGEAGTKGGDPGEGASADESAPTEGETAGAEAADGGDAGDQPADDAPAPETAPGPGDDHAEAQTDQPIPDEDSPAGEDGDGADDESGGGEPEPESDVPEDVPNPGDEVPGGDPDPVTPPRPRRKFADPKPEPEAETPAEDEPGDLELEAQDVPEADNPLISWAEAHARSLKPGALYKVPRVEEACQYIGNARVEEVWVTQESSQEHVFGDFMLPNDSEKRVLEFASTPLEPFIQIDDREGRERKDPKDPKDPKEGRSEKRLRSVYVAARCTDTEVKWIRTRAETCGLSVGEFLRCLALAQVPGYLANTMAKAGAPIDDSVKADIRKGIEAWEAAHLTKEEPAPELPEEA